MTESSGRAFQTEREWLAAAWQKARTWVIENRQKTARFAGRARLATAVLAAVLAAAIVAFVAYAVLQFVLPHGGEPIQPKDLTQFSLTIVAGIGGVVALVVAYRRQQGIEQGRFIERFGAAATQLGHADVAVRMAGVYAMAGVADEVFDHERQQCVDVLCGYLRLPYFPAIGANHESELQHKVPAREGEESTHRYLYRQNDKEVRQTIVRVIAAHLQEDSRESWSGCDFDFRGSALEEADFRGTVFAGGLVSFEQAVFSGDQTSFELAKFSSQGVSFKGAVFNGDRTSFDSAEFKGQGVSFKGAVFNGDGTSFDSAVFGGAEASFREAEFNAATTSFQQALFESVAIFEKANFAGAWTSFHLATFSAASATFEGAVFTGKNVLLSVTFRGQRTDFRHARFNAGLTVFDAKFSGETVWFTNASFSGGKTSFGGATFSADLTSFARCQFEDGEVSFENPRGWDPAPMFDWDTKPETVLPEEWPPQVQEGR